MRVFIPANLKGCTLGCELGVFVLDENMSKEQIEAAQKIHPQIRLLEVEEKPKKKGLK